MTMVSPGHVDPATYVRTILGIFYPGSQATLKTIACGSGGIFQAIPDGGALSTAMSFYYRYVKKSEGARSRDISS